MCSQECLERYQKSIDLECDLCGEKCVGFRCRDCYIATEPTEDDPQFNDDP